MSPLTEGTVTGWRSVGWDQMVGFGLPACSGDLQSCKTLKDAEGDWVFVISGCPLETHVTHYRMPSGWVLIARAIPPACA